jgi:hypothetical protein
MDVSSILFAVVCLGSILIIGDLAEDLGRKPSRWMWIAVAIGPLAIPLLYLVAGMSALTKMIRAARPAN